MNILILFLVFFPALAAIPGYFIAKRFEKIRFPLFIIIAAIEVAVTSVLCCDVFLGHDAAVTVKAYVGLGLYFKADYFRIIYCMISTFLWLMTVTFSREYMRGYHAKERYLFFCMVTLSGVMGVFLSSDLFTTFCFFEIMSFASYPLVIHEETPDAMKAGETYLGIAVISGMILLVGLFLIYRHAGTLSFEALREFYSSHDIDNITFCGGICILLGFGAKAGMYPLHIWLPKAHPVAPAPASALLSGILTKSGVFGIIVICADIFAHNKNFAYILLTLAVITMFLGALLALFSLNLKRTLACSSMSQIGFILVGTSFTLLLGEEGGLAQCGTLLHMANHSLIKLVLFMSAGVVAMNVHALDLNDIRGFGRKKPFLACIFAIGTVGIMGIPLFNGYASKTMLHEGIVEYIKEAGLTGNMFIIFKAVEWIFLISGGLTVAYMTKLFVCLFVEKNSDSEKQKSFDEKKNYLSTVSRIVFVLSAIPLLIIGFLPNFVNHNVISKACEFFGVEKFEKSVAFLGFESLKGAAISITIGALVYIVLVRRIFIRKGKYVNLWNKKLDMEAIIYRPVIVGGNLFIIQRVVSPIAYGFEFILVKGTLLFILYIARTVAYLFDLFILLLNRTVLREHIYVFREETLASRIGRLIEHISKKKSTRAYASKLDSLAETLSERIKTEYNSFSFAFAMIAIGITIILIFALTR